MFLWKAGTDRDQTRTEEITNSISHGVGIVVALVGAPFLIHQATLQGDGAYVFATCLFAATIIFLYLSSTLYHALPVGKAKRIFRVIEHSAIFLLIAGTYTPFTFGVLRGAWGWSLFVVIWGLAVAGVAIKTFSRRSHPILSTTVYLLMGWIIVVAFKPMMAGVPVAGLVWLVVGGLSYTIGVIFFVTDARVPYGHLIWHFFVLTGTICHYFAVLWYAA
ncbi:MAG: hemolysin III family protein [Proteobacteria bacterium]|nr:hemolysin III family protein [Pseudomonadota bacterium]MBU1687869.1 hemolysin III family protein [Pseudomonadota bacterium]